MVIPMNFVVGAVIGAVSTYVYKDDTAKEWIKETGGKIKDGSSSFMTSFKKKAVEEPSESIAEKGETIDSTAEVVSEKAKPETS
ncbi:MAG: Unknown protein [uncultured Thiotrichaceae bacterium]|uniref:YtxH domain-containing protein n=1 Tax=uncultured Thiotrichaceae bacterium TaxID=298394 RepID=A0A6S6UIX8_9GAMM|nr:MAG: Unknown protein [uncultured Thiotrichaceae bacterium]